MFTFQKIINYKEAKPEEIKVLVCLLLVKLVDLYLVYQANLDIGQRQKSAR